MSFVVHDKRINVSFLKQCMHHFSQNLSKIDLVPWAMQLAERGFWENGFDHIIFEIFTSHLIRMLYMPYSFVFISFLQFDNNKRAAQSQGTLIFISYLLCGLIYRYYISHVYKSLFIPSLFSSDCDIGDHLQNKNAPVSAKVTFTKFLHYTDGNCEAG